jgi:hypothetical protein
MEKTTLYLPADLRALLKEAARRTGRPEAVIVREALRTYLQQHRPTRIGPRTCGRDVHGPDPERVSADG